MPGAVFRSNGPNRSGQMAPANKAIEFRSHYVQSVVIQVDRFEWAAKVLAVRRSVEGLQLVDAHLFDHVQTIHRGWPEDDDLFERLRTDRLASAPDALFWSFRNSRRLRFHLNRIGWDERPDIAGLLAKEAIWQEIVGSAINQIRCTIQAGQQWMVPPHSPCQMLNNLYGHQPIEVNQRYTIDWPTNGVTVSRFEWCDLDPLR